MIMKRKNLFSGIVSKRQQNISRTRKLCECRINLNSCISGAVANLSPLLAFQTRDFSGFAQGGQT